MSKSKETCADEIPFWVECPDNTIPKNAMKGGKVGNEIIYIGRALHNNALTPGSVLSSQNSLFLAWGFEAHRKTDYEILCGGSSNNWVTSKGGEVPVNAFIAGYTEHGESLYIGRRMHKGNLLVGKIHPSYGICYIPDFEETMKELEFSDYEVLVT